MSHANPQQQPDKPRLVIIDWEDSVQPIAQWMYLCDLDQHQIVKCRSVGWLIGDGRRVKALAQNLGDIGRKDSIQVSGILKIPARCITRIQDLG